MFRQANSPVKRSKPQTDYISPRGIPSKGLNTVTPYGSMDEKDAIALNNLIVEAYGLRVRKGYSEWATGFPSTNPVHSILNYYPAIFNPEAQVSSAAPDVYQTMSTVGMVQPKSGLGPGPGTIFAAQGASIYDVTLKGDTALVPQVGVSGVTDYWNGINYQNVGGSFLLIANEGGGYAIFNGTTWSMPTFGTGVGQVSGVDPADIVWVCAWKERIWFFKKSSTKAYYLPPGQITGVATEFDFGNAMDHGGSLSFLGGWTLDGGIGTDDYLVAVGSQGDVIIYKGTDPDDMSSFSLHGVWYSGPLPVGLRCVEGSGGDIYILNQMGVIPVSALMKPTNLGAQLAQYITDPINPLIAILMRDYSNLRGWQVTTLAKEEMIVIRVPELATTYIANSFIAYKVTSKTWSILSGMPYAHTLNAGSLIYAGTLDGRVVRAFDGPLDNIDLDGFGGIGVVCRVTPAYTSLNAPGLNKLIKMVRPTFISANVPKISITVLSNYLPPQIAFFPTIPSGAFGGEWDEDYWDSAVWAGGLRSLHEWFGCRGWGHAVTVQLDFITGGDTILMGIDYWGSKGGVL